MGEILERLRSLSERRLDADGAPFWVGPAGALETVATEMGWTLRHAQISGLQERIVPLRYERNLGTVGWQGQIALLQASVAVLGVGGLGGWIVEGLARMGVGLLILVDCDEFDESNLNRQMLCTESNLGQSKVEAARLRVAEVNAAVEVDAHQVRVADSAGMVELLQGANTIVDALDSLPTRLALQRAARELSVPLVHGAIAGYVGQVMTIFPEDDGLLGLYGEGPVPERGIEVEWGNPAATPMMVAAWQVHEVVKLVSGRGKPLRHRMLFMDGETGTVDSLEV